MIIVCSACFALAAPPAEREITFVSPRGQTHRAIVTAPGAPERNGVAVLMVGGGAAWDEHWTVPGSYTIDGNTTRVTIDGQPTRDAGTIASALAARGFVVMRWSAIHADDERVRSNPALAEGLPFPYSVELTRAALAALRRQPEVDARRIAIVGHSLGAARACQVADDGVVAMVFLAGAYLSRTGMSPRTIADNVMQQFPGLDADADGTVNAAELAAWRPPTTGPGAEPPPLASTDKDGDGALRPWEIAAVVWIARAEAGDAALTPSKPTLGEGPWPAEVLASRPIPVLAIFGGLDPMSFHGPWLERPGARPGIDVAYFAGLGHQLAPEQDGLFGAMDAEVVSRIGRWLAERAAGTP